MAQIEPTAWYDVIVEAITEMYASKCIVLEEADNLVASLGPKEAWGAVVKKRLAKRKSRNMRRFLLTLAATNGRL